LSTEFEGVLIKLLYNQIENNFWKTVSHQVVNPFGMFYTKFGSFDDGNYVVSAKPNQLKKQDHEQP